MGRKKKKGRKGKNRELRYVPPQGLIPNPAGGPNLVTDGHLQEGSTEADDPLRGYAPIIPGQLGNQTEWVHQWPDTVRRARGGEPFECIEFKCPRCKRALLLNQYEAAHPPGQPVPLCGNCLAEGVRSVLTQRAYTSGPIDLRVE